MARITSGAILIWTKKKQQGVDASYVSHFVNNVMIQQKLV